MRVRNDSESNFDPGGNQAPLMFYGDSAPDTGLRFVDAPLMSLYWDVANSVLYIKTANNRAAADWAQMAAAGSTITGDLTLTGTLTAGDVVAVAS